MGTPKALLSDSTLEAATVALEECDHGRLPSYLVARIVLESAWGAVASEVDETVDSLKREVDELRRALDAQRHATA